MNKRMYVNVEKLVGSRKITVSEVPTPNTMAAVNSDESLKAVFRLLTLTDKEL